MGPLVGGRRGPGSGTHCELCGPGRSTSVPVARFFVNRANRVAPRNQADFLVGRIARSSAVALSRRSGRLGGAGAQILPGRDSAWVRGVDFYRASALRRRAMVISCGVGFCVGRRWRFHAHMEYGNCGPWRMLAGMDARCAQLCGFLPGKDLASRDDGDFMRWRIWRPAAMAISCGHRAHGRRLIANAWRHDGAAAPLCGLLVRKDLASPHADDFLRRRICCSAAVATFLAAGRLVSS